MRRMGPSHFTSAYGRRARPEFEVQLVASGWKGFRASEIDEVILACPPADVTRVCQSGVVAALLGYRQWDDAAQAVIAIWVGRLAGGHFLTPQLRAFGCSTANREKLALRLKSVFVSHIDGLLEGDAVQRCRKKLEVVEKEVADVKTAMKGRNALARYRALQEKVEGLNVQKNQIAKRLEEFQSAMLAVTSFLELSGEDSIESEAELFLLGDDQEPNWDRIHHVLLRECRRLQEGLPIYSCRRQILNHIHYRQVMILTGETGCGKSTQLIQYLADSELTRDGSVICTQPRKIAALSLAQRVGEECRGCYIGKSVICYPSYSSFQQLNTKIIYMTDNCLLQHFMLDTNLSRVSFIVIDEAHERSLNTDLLLALLKKLLLQRPDLRLIIMSATADARKLSEYFFGCDTFHVTGRTYPVDIKYVPSLLEPSNANFSSLSSLSCPYVIDVVKTANKIHKTEKDGSILAFLTSQAEVEWACENFQNPSAVALALHGKLSCDEQSRVFQDYPDKRKVIFATNVAETSLTIPGVKYVIDSGMVKESRFDPRTGTNVLNVCKISQSSANQRSGRAGRTEPGKCYRLYSEQEFQSMQSHQDPEIRRVHLGIAVLKIVALGITNVLDFEFVDSPSPEAVELAIRNLVHLGAVICKNNTLELTDCGHCLVKLGIEPRLGKLILCSFDYGLRREGVILAAVMANASSIFCRIGSAEEKTRSDCLKLQFCHPNGDLFTLLAVYKEWEDALKSRKNIWCWENSVNAKSMRRCKEAVVELEYCLRHELNIIIPSYWLWKPHLPSKHDNMLKMVILSSLSENVAVFSGHDRLGYEVAMTGQLIQLHPSCSLLAYGQKPNWVVYVKAKITWPRRQSKGVAIIRCAPNDVTVVAEECSAMLIGGRYVHCDVSTKFPDSAVIMGLSKDVLEAEIWEALRNRTTRKILDVHLLRGQVVHQPSGTACEEALLKEITDFVPGDKCHVHMFNSEPKDYLMKAWITFDGNLHLRAAMALDHLHGKVLSCCLPWQRVHCEHIFQSLVSCPSSVYFVIKKDLESLFEKMKFQKDAVVSMERTGSGSFRVKIVASALRTVAQCRLSFEKLMKGKTITHVDLTVSVLQVLFTQVGIQLLKSLERETGTYILFDRHNLSLKAFGPQQGIAVAEKKLVESLLALHREKECEIHLRGAEMPHNLMKEIVRLFGPDLHGLKQKVAGVDFKLNVRRHILSFSGSKEQKHQIENIIAGIVQDMSGRQVRMHNDEATCPICLSEVEDGFKLEACGHEFCRLCLIDQIEAAIHSRDGFPLCCIDEGCKMPFFLVDLRSLLSSEQLDELFRASVGAFVASSGGKYRFCPTPDCPSVYKVADPESPVGLFICGACSAEICTKCHIESHPFMTCEQYKEFKEDPDRSLKEWKRGKEHVKNCLACGYTIEKVDGCNHVECKCGNHICWVCLAGFPASDDCYAHMRSVHPAG
ncbi:ATP-dependent RNA helicase DEAH12, chloroplastic-like isoform X3 [Nymphaea colorata]|uniref:ATP-dependent RNA helicase DEAH12, chloroplastic-like isoform X3 n=1 Tax=Nymphaea colorata TaxID=210225 RepID=UPI00129EF4E6|nr:ATP-dependent RNA helicase DEAH12, chloroplastic-like isoform X3 [Nymphaea colorata]